MYLIRNFVLKMLLVNKLCWLPFYEGANIARCSFVFKRLQGSLPIYLNDPFIVNNERHSRSTRYSNYNVVCPHYTRETEGGRTFSVITSKLWNSLPLPLRKSQSVGSFRRGLWKLKFDEQQVLSHFM